MKNIHLIPTDKPSRLWTNNLKRRLVLDEFPSQHPTNIAKNIYIASDKEIKEGDWVITNGGLRFVTSINNDKSKTFTDDGSISKQSPSPYCYLEHYKKIILTTDQDLDGVQAIDDEFLEWFVKNPSCEEVKVEKENICARCHSNDVDECWSAKECSDGRYDKIKYKIIIPKEEPKQTPITFVPDKRMYSEAIKFGKWLDENIQQREYYPMSTMTMEELFKQFKKK
jgi:hypothetical protein